MKMEIGKIEKLTMEKVIKIKPNALRGFIKLINT